MAASMVSVAEARARAARTVERSQRDWAAAIALGEQPDATVELVLRPPTERQALANLSDAIGWAGQWREADAAARGVAGGTAAPGGAPVRGGSGVTWTERRWPSVGAQLVPERLVLHGAEAIAGFAGASSRRDWRRLAARAGTVRERFAVASARDGIADALSGAVRAEWRALIEYADAEFATLLDVVEWLVEHPSSGRRVRELPIRGIDTKWLERHRRAVESLALAVTGGTTLGLAESQSTVRVRFLDVALRPGGIEDLAAPIVHLARLEIAPRVVFVFENLETVLAMPPMTGAVVVHGSGYAAPRLGDVPWIRRSRVVYWGDLDSDGFRVLHTLRVVVPDATSVLMDEATLDAFADLAVVEKRSAPGAVDLLTEPERRTRERLRADGGVRLEQERIPWAHALGVLEAAAIGR
ncbi:Wadjet anti-phage system protein JetD domain-containing protein [Agromyces marinus]|uniref:DUF3322 and DUF2220 domain-containing protein n=1 Tax=Agromyces marinus TaxID=1389020 RepID=A0ABM8H3H9_9MICO|nr:DUF3322 and DUF2220 domain-containing protein [Agromyces marinus]UIP59598.1 hypothetical protein DSM26151_25090 [Agromyces marinus]BDZ55342.1 hypothetical protein GCM10025870_24150 [Agromyces marinus]